MNNTFPIIKKGLLQQVFACSSEPTLITTKEPKIVYVNPAWEKLTGYVASDVLGKNPNILKSGKTPRSVYKKMWVNLQQNISIIRNIPLSNPLSLKKIGSIVISMIS